MTEGTNVHLAKTRGDVPKLPEYDDVIAQYRGDGRVREHAHHNHNYWRWIHGGLSLVRTSPLSFDPVEEYWYCTERRLLAAFFASRFRESYAPAEAMRTLAFRAFRHFQRLREDGLFGERRLATVQAGLWPDFCDIAVEAARTLPDLKEYDALRRVWGRRLRNDTFKKELIVFLEEAKKAKNLGNIEPPFFARLAWFPYMGLQRLEDLMDRQRFFFGYYELLASTNSYMQGGSMSFAPVIQNNPTDVLLEYVDRWAKGETPQQTGFFVEGRSEKRDRSHHSAVVEMYGFLNLHKVPFNNSVVAATYELLAQDDDSSVFDWLERLGRRSRAYLEAGAGRVAELARLFRRLAAEPLKNPELTVEGIRLENVAKQLPAEHQALVEHKLVAEMNDGALKAAQGLSDLDAATAMLHLMLDAAIYVATISAPPPPPRPPGVSEPPAPPLTTLEKLRLPPSLGSIANDALGYLRGGYHVLFAGPPGTGKTTLAQLIGHAWNRELASVAKEIDMSEAPITTVGNSAWSPFHTIGGILPDSESRFVSARGIFIDPGFEEAGEWRLRGECLVLDEMNRADLDRCIGELYPLLSRSVRRVHPAGIPGVRSIRLNPRFRIVATVNDTTLDDVVFPISEGLARRFIRLELPGATKDDLEGFLAAPEANAEARRKVALEVIEELFDICASENRLVQTEVGEHLPFGVGYFASLGAWVSGSLGLSPEFSERDSKDQARLLLRTSLNSAVRVRGLDSVLEKLVGTEEEG